MLRGYFGIGIYHGKTCNNVGTLWRSAQAFGASFIFTIGKRYKHQSSDTGKAPRHVPLFEFQTFDEFIDTGLPYSCPLVGIEITDAARPLSSYSHPVRACYLLGAEDHGLPAKIIDKCRDIVQIDGPSRCLNVSTAGSIIMYDRITKLELFT